MLKENNARESTLLDAGLFKPKSPEYTIRMLLGSIISDTKEIPKLKPFSHFTLGCTFADESLKVKEALEQLSRYLKGPVIFKAQSVVNLGTESKPLWCVTLNLGTHEDRFRDLLSSLFDSIMCPERNGVLYLWKSMENWQKRCPHIAIGTNPADEETAKKLLAANCQFVFNRLDYKKVGPQEPHVIKNLESETNTNTLLESCST